MTVRHRSPVARDRRRRTRRILTGLLALAGATLGALAFAGRCRPATDHQPAGSQPRHSLQAAAPAAHPAEPAARFLDDPTGHALATFHRALARTQRGEGQTRVAAYGASHAAVDHYLGQVRRLLQARYGDGGRGFAMAAWPAVPHYWQSGVRIAEGKGFDALRIGVHRNLPDQYGPAGIVFDSEGREAIAFVATTEEGIGSRASRIIVQYAEQPGGGDLVVSIDGRSPTTLTTAAPSPRATERVFAVADRPHEVHLRAVPGRPVRIYGVALERVAPGVIVDNLGLIGSRARDQLRWLAESQRDLLATRRPDLVLFAYGGNEANDSGETMSRYVRETEAALHRLRSPEGADLGAAACVVVGPLDKPLRNGDGWLPRPRTTAIAAAQRSIAHAQGCAYFDSLAFMGGPLSMVRWARTDPPLARDDYVHLTAAGYRRYGEALVAALLDGMPAPEAPSGKP